MQGVTTYENIERIEKAIWKIQMMRPAIIHDERLNSPILAMLCKSMIMPSTTFAIHPMPQNEKLQTSWDKLEQKILKIALGCFMEFKKAILRPMARLLMLEQIKSVHAGRMRIRLQNRGKVLLENEKAQKDPGIYERLIRSLKPCRGGQLIV